LGNLGSGAGELYRFTAAEPWLRETIAFATAHERDSTARYATAWLALCELYLGRWDDAAAHAGEAMANTESESTTRVMSLVALGRLRVRRGDPGTAEALDQALALADASGTLQRVAPVRAARAEAAFERGDLACVEREARAALPLAQRYRHPWFIGELAFWCWRAGALAAAPADCAEPYALQIAGRWRDATTAWQQLGCPYEQARALADGDVDAQREALALFEQLGARPAADALRRRLHEAGVRGLARGARPSTREHAYGLTTRELEVLQLLCDGLRNAEIAERLSRSVRTVDHHLAAVFVKLGVDSRVAAIQAAQHAGLTTQSRQATAPK
jgi:ATP/maltotriose-dependent transcriptional regulator MalT